jgi:hypothetical protein
MGRLGSGWYSKVFFQPLEVSWSPGRKSIPVLVGHRQVMAASAGALESHRHWRQRRRTGVHLMFCNFRAEQKQKHENQDAATPRRAGVAISTTARDGAAAAVRRG